MDKIYGVRLPNNRSLYVNLCSTYINYLLTDLKYEKHEISKEYSYYH